MSIITQIKNSNNKKRSSIYIDGNFVCFLDNFTIFKYKLKENKEISLDELQQIQLESEEDFAFDMAIKYLSKYIKSTNEVANYLNKKGFLPLVVDKTMDKIKKYKYIDDSILANNIVQTQSNKYGKQKLKYILKNRGINDEDIINSLENIENEFDNVLALSKKYMKNKENTLDNFQKLSKFLAGRGFSWEDINRAINQIKKDFLDENWN